MSNFKSTFAITIALILGLPTTVRGQEVLSDLRPLRQLYKQNQLAAQDKYSGNFYEIRGTVSGIYSDDSKVVVDLPGVNVFCYYKQSEYNKVVRLRDKGPVTIKGVLKVDTGWFGNPILTVKNCKIVANQRAQNNYPSQNNSTQVSTIQKKSQITRNKSNSSISKFPNTCFTSAHPDASDSYAVNVKCKVENTEPGVVIVKWSDGYTTKFTIYTDNTVSIENINSKRKEFNTTKWGSSNETLYEHEGKSYVVVTANDGAVSYIPNDALKY